MIEKIKKIDKYYIAIFLVALFILAPYISKIFYLGHDSGYHIFNSYGLESIWNFVNTFQIKVIPILTNDFGYGSAIFYPQLSHFLIAFNVKILSLFNLNIIYAIKVVLFFIVFCSGICMYKLVLKLLKNKSAAFVSSVFYMTAPYFVSDIFIRSSYAEAIVFVFLPIVFLSIIYLFEKDYRRFYILFIIGYVGLINSHLVMTVYITLFLIGIFILNIRKFLKKDIIISFINATIIVLLICLPFIIPLVEHKLFGNYAVFAPNYMATDSSISDCRLKMIHIFSNVSHYNIKFFLNILSVILFCMTCYNYKKLRSNKNCWILKGSIIMAFVSFIMASEFFPWLIMPRFLRFIQFPWRLEVMLIFFISIASSFALLLFDKSQQKILVIICLVTSAICVNQVVSNLEMKKIEKKFFDDTHTEISMKEYYPMKSVKNFDYISNRNSDVLLLKGQAKVEKLKDDVPYLKFKLSDVSKDTVLELPRIYYLGYTVIQKDSSGNEKELRYFEDKYGMMKIRVSKESTIEVDYTGTKLSNVGNIISFITIICCFGYLAFTYKKKKQF